MLQRLGHSDSSGFEHFLSSANSQIGIEYKFWDFLETRLYGVGQELSSAGH
jgi:hypothetical protein